MAEGISLLFTLRARNEASTSLKQLEASIASVKQRIKELKTETDVPFKSDRLEALQNRLKALNAEYKALKQSTTDSARALDNDLNSALSTISPRLAGLVGAAGPVTLLAIGFTAAAAAGVALGAALFHLTKQTAEFEGKFYDLSQQVGVSVETLSALNNIAENTGGNIDTVVGSLAIFQKHLEASHDPTSKEAKLLKDLGVTSLDTETALRQVIKGLFDLGETEKQTDNALQLFGRSGRFVNAILKESKGDIDAAAAAFGPLSQVTLEAARAADEFNDSYNNLTRTLAGIRRAIVSDVVPVFTLLFQDLNRALTGNAEDWSFWSDVVKTEIAGVVGTFQGFVQYIATRGNIDLGIAIDQSIRGILERSEQLKNKLRFESDVARIQRLTQSLLAGRPGDRPDVAKAAADALTRANKEIAAAQKAFEENFRFQRGQLERDRALDLKSIEEWASESIRLVNERNTLQTRLLDQELAVVRKYVKDRADLQLAETEIAAKRQKLTNETFEARQRIEDEAQKRREQSELRLNQQLLAIREAQRAGELEANKRFLEQGIIFESEALRRQLEVVRQSHADREILRDLERAQLTTSAARKIELDNERIESEQRLTNETLRLIDERRRALSKEAAEGVPRPGTLPISPDIPNISDILSGEGIDAPTEGFKGLQAAIDGVGTSLGNLLGASRDFGLQFGDVIGSAIDSLAFGIGDLVNQWVLLGETGPAAMRKLTASVLAGLAAQAAVKAIFQLAEGFAALFFNPAQAVAHFKSAALFGAIAGAAAVAGRSVAGDLFKPQSSAGAGESGSTPQPLNTIAGRNQAQRVEVLIRQDIRTDGGQIVRTFVDDFNNGGVTREVILNDGR